MQTQQDNVNGRQMYKLQQKEKVARRLDEIPAVHRVVNYYISFYPLICQAGASMSASQIAIQIESHVCECAESLPPKRRIRVYLLIDQIIDAFVDDASVAEFVKNYFRT